MNLENTFNHDDSFRTPGEDELSLLRAVARTHNEVIIPIGTIGNDIDSYVGALIAAGFAVSSPLTKKPNNYVSLSVSLPTYEEGLL